MARNPETASLEFSNPNGRPYPTANVADADVVVQENVEAGIVPGPDTIIPAGRGERYDHELTIWAIVNHPRPDSTESPTGASQQSDTNGHTTPSGGPVTTHDTTEN